MDLNQVRSMISQALNDQYSPKKIDKYEALEIRQKLQDSGALNNEAVKAYLQDQIQAGHVEKGNAQAIFEGMFSPAQAPAKAPDQPAAEVAHTVGLFDSKHYESIDDLVPPGVKAALKNPPPQTAPSHSESGSSHRVGLFDPKHYDSVADLVPPGVNSTLKSLRSQPDPAHPYRIIDPKYYDSLDDLLPNHFKSDLNQAYPRKPY